MASRFALRARGALFYPLGLVGWPLSPASAMEPEQGPEPFARPAQPASPQPAPQPDPVAAAARSRLGLGLDITAFFRPVSKQQAQTAFEREAATAGAAKRDEQAKAAAAAAATDFERTQQKGAREQQRRLSAVTAAARARAAVLGGWMGRTNERMLGTVLPRLPVRHMCPCQLFLHLPPAPVPIYNTLFGC